MRPFNTALANQLQQVLGAPRPCFKTGYASREAAQAHIRSLVKNQDRKPDRKNFDNIDVYECKHRACQHSGKPFHVGHGR